MAEVAGDRIDLAILVGADTDAHTYQPKPTDARTPAMAQAMVSNGLGFEGWIDRLAEAVLQGPSVVATAGVPTLRGRPHAAPIRMAAGRQPHAPLRRQHRRGPGRGGSGECCRLSRARRYDQRLADLDLWIKAEIAKVPADQRKAITGHDLVRDRRGLRRAVPGAAGYNTNSEPSARDVAALIRLVREQKIKALFVENMTNPAWSNRSPANRGAVVGPRLYSDALSGSAALPRPTRR